MKKTNVKPTSTVKIQSGLKAGGLAMNHNQSLVKVRSGLKAGGMAMNHNQALLGA